MIREIYTRDPNDPNYIKRIIDTNNVTENVLAKVRMCLGTQKGDVLGERDLGCDIEKWIFQTKRSNIDIEDKLRDLFNTYINGMQGVAVTPSVKFGHAEGYDYAIIDIQVNDERCASFLVD